MKELYVYRFSAKDGFSCKIITDVVNKKNGDIIERKDTRKYSSLYDRSSIEVYSKDNLNKPIIKTYIDKIINNETMEATYYCVIKYISYEKVEDIEKLKESMITAFKDSMVAKRNIILSRYDDEIKKLEKEKENKLDKEFEYEDKCLNSLKQFLNE